MKEIIAPRTSFQSFIFGMIGSLTASLILMSIQNKIESTQTQAINRRN